MNILQQALNDSLKQYQDLERRLSESADKSIQDLNKLDSYLSQIKSGKLIYKEAITRVVKRDREAFYKLLYEEAIAAAVRSGEYNYSAYLERLAKSIESADISVKFSGKALNIKIDLSPLGSIQDWGNVIKQVRRNPRNLANRQKKRGGENLAYYYWRTRIYKTRKYDDTIGQQLSLVKGAPFWYLIEYGNANPPGFQVVAPAYPKVKRSSFIAKTERRIRLYIQNEVEKLIPEIEAEWVEIISKSLGKKLTPKLEKALKESKDTIALYIYNLKDAPKLKINDIVARISTTEKEFNIIVTSKSLGLRSAKIGKGK